MNVSARLAWNSIIAWVSSLAGAAGGFILVAYLFDRLGIEEYGVVGLLDRLIVFTMLSDLGMRGALGRHLVEHITRGDQRRMNQLLSLSAAVYFGIAAILFAVCWIGAPCMVRGLKITGPDEVAAIWLVRLFVPTYTLTMFVGTSFTAVIESHHRFDIVDLTHTAEVALRLALVILFISQAGWGLAGWAAGYLLAKLASTLVYAVYAWRLSPSMAIRPKYLAREGAEELFSLGGAMFLYQTVLKLNAQTDPFILAIFWGPLAAGLYDPALRVIIAVSPFVAVVNRQLRPLATKYFVEGRMELVQELLIRGTKISLLLSLPFTVICICFAGPLFRLWLDSDKLQATAGVLILWALADLASNAAGAQFQVLLGMNRIRFLVTAQSVAATINVFASLIAVGGLYAAGWSLNAGLYAVVVPTIVCAWIQRAIVSVHVARQVRIGVGRYLRQAFLPALIVGCALLAIGWGLRASVQLDTWPRFIAASMVIGLAWFAITWIAGLDATDRRRVIQLATRRGRLPAESPPEIGASASHDVVSAGIDGQD